MRDDDDYVIYVKERFWKNVVRKSKTDCWTWNGRRSEWDNGIFRFDSKTPRREILAHNMSWLIAFGTIPKDMLVLHKCHNPPCVNPHHLKLGTQKANMKEARIARRFRGKKNVTPKKTVAEIKRLIASGVKLITITRKFGLSYHIVQSIASGKTFKNVPLAKKENGSEK